jgi:alpha-galactosidase
MDEDLDAVARAHAIDLTGGMLDEIPALSLSPEISQSFPGHPGLLLRDTSGAPVTPRFIFEGEEVGAQSLTLRYKDAAAGIALAFSFTSDPQTHVITAQTRFTATRDDILVEWLSAPVLPTPQHADDMIDFSGRWCGEFQPVRNPWTPGIRLRENRTGRSGHEHFPGLIIPARGTLNTQGEAYAFHYGWSGGHRMIAEELPDGRRQVQFGHAQGRAGAGAGAGEISSAPLYLTYSGDGLNGCAVAFQRHARARIVKLPTPAGPRPVHYNCWEAVYFDHQPEVLKDIATRAANLGAERFVLDDGWFGQRDDDRSSLGDWWVNTRKYPDGLQPLIDHVHGLGMGFGLWFEPEMINEDSDLFRAHPEWVLGAMDQPRGRQQLVLNMALPEVQSYLYDSIAAILSSYAVEYIKWDHNRVLPGSDPDQTFGTYALLDRLRADFPLVEIESCASGGGRIDFGILARTHRVWLSDSNDALERLRIQHDAALFLPGSVTGSHVGPRHCHTSGRDIDIVMRAWVAAQRHMGFEMDPRELTEREAAVLTAVTSWWKANRGWMLEADILRLDSADPAVIAEMQRSQDGARFVAFVGKPAVSAQISPRPLRLTGLEPQAEYRIELINRAEAPGLSRGKPALKSGPLNLSGAYLMQHGVTLPWHFPETMWVLEGTRLDAK